MRVRPSSRISVGFVLAGLAVASLGAELSALPDRAPGAPAARAAQTAEAVVRSVERRAPALASLDHPAPTGAPTGAAG